MPLAWELQGIGWISRISSMLLGRFSRMAGDPQIGGVPGIPRGVRFFVSEVSPPAEYFTDRFLPDVFFGIPAGMSLSNPIRKKFSIPGYLYADIAEKYRIALMKEKIPKEIFASDYACNPRAGGFWLSSCVSITIPTIPPGGFPPDRDWTRLFSGETDG